MAGCPRLGDFHEVAIAVDTGYLTVDKSMTCRVLDYYGFGRKGF
jgi:hypothetical protein